MNVDNHGEIIIYDGCELDENSTCRKFRQVRKEGKREVSREMSFYPEGELIRQSTVANFATVQNEGGR